MPPISRHFKTVATAWFNSKSTGWVQAHADRVWSRLEGDVLPAIGMRDVAEIKPADILAIVRSVESRGALDVAKRIRQTISSIFRYAVASSLATTDPAAPLVDAMLPKPRVKRTRATGVAETVAGFTVSRERWLTAMSSTLARRACGSTLDRRGRRDRRPQPLAQTRPRASEGLRSRLRTCFRHGHRDCARAVNVLQS
ncbi:tyrosine-type recombinase/integrase [Kaistia sp. UC242_56]|uniref:tyrosine-type recombinase/integrase n=1 Tax=Kaistia sp. UC242_56 TaxID=3374625 RepID=UPI0037A48790